MDITLTVLISAVRTPRTAREFLSFFLPPSLSLSLSHSPFLPFREFSKFVPRVQPVTLLIPSSLWRRAKPNKLATLSCRGPEDFRLPVEVVEVNIRYSLLKSIVTQ